MKWLKKIFTGGKSRELSVSECKEITEFYQASYNIAEHEETQAILKIARNDPSKMGLILGVTEKVKPIAEKKAQKKTMSKFGINC